MPRGAELAIERADDFEVYVQASAFRSAFYFSDQFRMKAAPGKSATLPMNADQLHAMEGIERWHRLNRFDLGIAE